jgi:hypothetical protein
MEWKSYDGLRQGKVSAMILSIVGVLWIGIQALSAWSWPTLREVEVEAGSLIFVWAVGVWADKTDNEKRNMWEAMNQLDKRLDTVTSKLDDVLAHQGRIEDCLYAKKDFR